MNDRPKRTPQEIRKLAEAAVVTAGKEMLRARERGDGVAWKAGKIVLAALDALTEDLDRRYGLGPLESRSNPFDN